MQAQIDPYEFRRSMLDKQPRWQMVLDTAAKKAEWGRAPSGHHQGIALMSGYDTYLAQVAEVSVQGNQLKIHRIVCAIDCGQMVNPDIVHAQAEGSIVFGLTAALFSEINIANGRVKEQNFDDYRLLRMNETPQIEVYCRRQHREAGRHGRAGGRAGRAGGLQRDLRSDAQADQSAADREAGIHGVGRALARLSAAARDAGPLALLLAEIELSSATAAQRRACACAWCAR